MKATTKALLKLDREQEASWNEIFGMLTGFRSSLLIIEATELGYFRNAPANETADQIAERIAITPIGAMVLVDALCSLNLVRKDDDRYTVREDMYNFFNGPADRNMEFNIIAFKREIEVWSQMAQTMRGQVDRRADYTGELLDSKIEKYAGLTMLNRLDAETMIPTVVKYVPDTGSVLDIAGGEGYYAMRLNEMKPASKIDVLDLKTGFEICKKYNAAAIRSNHVNMLVADALELEVEKAYDVVIMNELLELFSTNDKKDILQRAARAVKPGGHLIVTKFPIDEEGTGPGRFPLFSIRMYLKFVEGYLEKDVDVERLLSNSDFCLVEKSDANRTVLVFKRNQ